MKNYNIEPDKILPTFGEVFNQIEVFRKNSIINNKENDNYTQCYNNISILGGRGTGKTSLLIEIRKELEKSKDNIIFDIITPDIDDKEDTLGWVVSLLIEKLNEFRNDNSLSCPIYNNHYPIDDSINKLTQSYFFRQAAYEKVIVNDYTSKIDYLKDNENKLNADVELKKNFNNFIDSIIESKQKLNNDLPMLIFMFDDVDIHCRKINEVLTTIMKYLCHPNIVNVIAADYSSAKENIVLEMLKEDEVLNKTFMDLNIDGNNYSIIKNRENRGYDFLKKILPPAYRHWIPKLNSKGKYYFLRNSIFTDKAGNEFKEVQEKIKEYIYYNKNYEESTILYDYVCFMDDTIRGCSNVVDFIKSRNIDKEFLKSNKTIKFNFLDDLLKVIIESNRDLGKKKYLIEKVINLYQNDRYNDQKFLKGINFNGYINYHAIIDDIRKNCGDVLNEIEFNLYYKIFILANIFEILIICLELRNNEEISNDKLHGLKELTFILNSTTSNNIMSLVPKLRSDIDNKHDIQEIISIKESLFGVLRYNEIQQLFKEENSGYLESVYIDSFSVKGEIGYYLGKIFTQDMQWVSSVVDWIINNAPDENMIKDKMLTNLKDKYGYDMSEAIKCEYETLEIDDYFENEDIWSVSNNILTIIKKCIEDIQSYRKLKFRLEELRREIDNYEDNINVLRSQFKVKYDERNYNKIVNRINMHKEFINDEFNKELWNRTKDKMIILSDDNRDNLFYYVGDIIEVDIKSKIKDVLNFDKDYFENLKTDKILIKESDLYKDEEMLSFIRHYYESLMVVDQLNNHPIIKNRNDIIISERYKSMISLLNNEIIRISEEIEYIIERLKINPIIIYTLKKDKISIDKFKIDILNKRYYESIEIKIKSFIDVVIDFYEKDLYKFKVANFENLLNRIIEEINNLKSIDKEIYEYLYLEDLDLKDQFINHYESLIKSIVSNIDIYTIENIRTNMKGNKNSNKMIYRLNNSTKNNKASQLEKLLKLKESELEDESYKIKIKVFNYALNLTLCKYLYYGVEENKNELNRKVRTRYLIDKQRELKKIIYDENLEYDIKQKKEFISFYEYLRSKFS